MTKLNILDVHKNCLDFLLLYQATHDEFYFVPRRRNNQNRLEKGMYFVGGTYYVDLSFWIGEDSKEKIHNIAFVINDKSNTYLEISCRDNDKKALYTNELVHILKQELNYDFNKVKENKWQFYYENDNYLEVLVNFLEIVKPIIDKYVLEHPESGIKLADKNFDDRYVKSLPCYIEVLENINKFKSTNAIIVKPSEYIMTLRHNQLSNELIEYLKNNRYNNVITDEDFVDIKAIDENGMKIYFELKTATTVKYAIREALGQLLEYNHYSNKYKADKLIIITKHEPEAADIQYLTSLRLAYNLPIYYQQFNMDTKELSKEY